MHQTVSSVVCVLETKFASFSQGLDRPRGLSSQFPRLIHFQVSQKLLSRDTYLPSFGLYRYFQWKSPNAAEKGEGR